MEKRPTGITVIAVLAAIGGVLGLLGGLALMTASSALNAIAGAAGVSYPLFSVSVWAFIIIVLAVLELVAAFGAWTLKKWAWGLLIGLMVFGAIQNLLFIGNSASSSLIGLAINGAVLYYLFQPNIKSAFGK